MTGKDAYIVGGANSAGQAALHLADYARSVTLVVRAETLGAGIENLKINSPTSLRGIPRDRPNADAREDLRTVIDRVGKIIHEQRVLRRDVASGDTVAAIGARQLHDADMIGFGRTEVNIDRRAYRGLCELGTHGLEHRQFRKRQSRVRVGHRAQHLAGACVSGGETAVEILAQRRRPSGIGEHAPIGLERYVGIDQGTTAQTAADGARL